MQWLSKKNMITTAVILILATIFYLSQKSGMFENPTAEGLRDYIASYGVFGPIVYMTMFSVIPAGSVIAVAGGMAFGMYFGTLYTIIGAMIGATVAFYISRLLGRDFVEKLVKGKMQKFEDGMEKGGFLLVLMMRLIPIIPFNVISYGAGLTRIKYIDYILSTMIGIIPGVLVFTNLGDKALCVRSLEFMLAVGILALMVIASILLKRRFSFEELQTRFYTCRIQKK
ncbi:TVP38/TMEM64 family protein [Pelotomaculum terephthalicicum JT]|uniref:TVP38/TMEM64 family protein n=1 Tax=Pelotomaculum TaxID=191373 RepID=UPI0009C68F2A|nr:MULTISPECIES: TVP38/TMEM64 family protein [Pelotomaculum]MCG9968219.1 TVP38/TMEM64 family protein [Pelotomaculum terephthalicicum JT]OPX89122.1 MAG: TVP38/TMEM64 family inner membrane protein YdjZ [Pelotomaculum sp. PtaB.Bin117]